MMFRRDDHDLRSIGVGDRIRWTGSHSGRVYIGTIMAEPQPCGLEAYVIKVESINGKADGQIREYGATSLVNLEVIR